MGLIINKEVGVYWAQIKPVQIGDNVISKVNVRIMHDDLFRHATFAVLCVTAENLEVQNLNLTIKDAPATEDSLEIKDYSNWINTAEETYKMVCKRLGFELIKK